MVDHSKKYDVMSICFHDFLKKYLILTFHSLKDYDVLYV